MRVDLDKNLDKDVFHTTKTAGPFRRGEVRCAIARTHAHTCAKAFRSDKSHKQIKLLTTHFCYSIACVCH